MRKMTFEMITDSRFDKNWKELAENYFTLVKEKLGNIDGVELEYDRALIYEFPCCMQARKRFYVSKNTRKITWENIMKIVNDIRPVPYDWRKE